MSMNKICDCLARVMNGLQYYESLNLDNKDDIQKFVAYFGVKYQTLLDDFIHIVTKHSHNFDELHEEVAKCSITQCSFAKRHYRNRREDQHENATNATFYSDIMDQIHC
eukprot:167416_1